MTAETGGMFRRIWLVGFAGHRRVDQPAMAKAVIRRELEALASQLNGELVGVSSAAAGADLLFLEACGDLGIRTVVILPFSRDRFSEDFDDPAEWAKAVRLMDAALWCEVAPGGEASPAAYHVVARVMLEVCERMIFLWDGKPARGLGGTGETVAEAADWGIPARVIDAVTFEAAWRNGEPREEKVDPDFADLPAARSVESLFDQLDARALAGAPRSRYFAAASMSVNHVATFVSAALAALGFLLADGAGILKFVLAIVAAILPWVGSRMRLQERWTADRVRAELLRSLIASHEPGSPLRPAALELFERHERFLRSTALQLVASRVPWEEARDRYLVNRVDNQIGFFAKRGGLARKRMRVYGLLFWIASWGALVSGALLIATKGGGSGAAGAWITTLAFLSAVFPGLAAWSMAMVSVFEFKRRSSLYSKLVGELETLRPKIAAAKCASATAAAIHRTEQLLLTELWEWQGPRRK